ncbi:MAG: hypothetical protein MR209_04305 [Veillonellaceae bacterium]|nr:hypothetical protein [Veillonellaceae bacterium]
MPEARMRKSMLLRVTAYWLMAMPIPLGLYLWHTPLSVYYAFYAFSLLGWLVPMACGRWWEKDKNLRWQGVLVFTLLWLCGFAVMYGAQRLFWNYEHLLWQTYGPGFCALIAAAQMYLQLFGISAVGQSIWWGVRRVTGWLQAYLILALIVGVLPNAIPICYLCGFYFADSYLTGTVSALASTGGYGIVHADAGFGSAVGGDCVPADVHLAAAGFLCHAGYCRGGGADALPGRTLDV